MADRAPSTSRRSLLAASGAITVASLLPLLPSNFPRGAVPALAATEPDAELIGACEGYIAAMEAYNRGDLDSDVSPHWADAQAHFLRFFETKPAQTLAGVVAQARVAAFLAEQPDSTDWRTAFTGQWPQWALEDLLHLIGGDAA